MSSAIVGTIDLAAFFAFTLSVLIALQLWLRHRTDSTAPARGFAMAALGVYAVVSLSNALEHLGITAALDPFEDYVEILFVPLMLYVAYSWTSALERDDLARALNLLESEHDLLEHVVDTAPVGIVVTDHEGRITFANARAESLLKLESEEARPGLAAPLWLLRRDGHAKGAPVSPGRFHLPGDEEAAFSGVPATLTWPDGRRTRLSVSRSTLGDPGESAALQGFVYAFEDLTSRASKNR
jgi:PAS domain-containing protein